jgi:predicted enzyme related to lactoylglutathione lyase
MQDLTQDTAGGDEREEAEMLEHARITAVVPVSDIEAAVRFYGDTLGLTLKERRSDLPENREAEFEAGDGTMLAYESVGAGKSRHTVAGFRVEDIDAAVASLRERGVVFEEYDLPDLKTENGIAALGDVRAAWCRDPDGNILAVESVGSR